MTDYTHTTVLLHEAVAALQIIPSGVYVDATLGGGGHSRAILDSLDSEGRLFVFDQDEEAWPNAPEDDRVVLVKENFRHLEQYMSYYKEKEVDGILADIGVSSHHFDTAERGFSYRHRAVLDMRMDLRTKKTAADILASYDADELQKVLGEYGEVSNARTLAKAIVNRRAEEPFLYTDDLSDFLDGYARERKVKYKSKVFQALRMEVNDEIGALQELLGQSAAVLREKARLVVISFHSLEDRAVKNMARAQVLYEDPLTGARELERHFRAVNKKPIMASEEEIKCNPRARSARLRILEKI